MLDNESYINGIKLNLLDNVLKNYILEVEPILLSECKKLISFYNKSNIKSKEKYFSIVLKDLKPYYLLNICLLYFIRIATFANTDDTNNIYLIKIAKDIGDRLTKVFLYNLKRSENNKDKFSS
jgi:hypothetical protein